MQPIIDIIGFFVGSSQMETQLDMSSISVLIACLAASTLLVTYFYRRIKTSKFEDQESKKEAEAFQVKDILNKLESAADVSQSKTRKKMPPSGESRD